MLFKTRKTSNRQSILSSPLTFAENVYRAMQFLENADVLKIKDTNNVIWFAMCINL
jgi:hypothetical protein